MTGIKIAPLPVWALRHGSYIQLINLSAFWEIASQGLQLLFVVVCSEDYMQHQIYAMHRGVFSIGYFLRLFAD